MNPVRSVQILATLFAALFAGEASAEPRPETARAFKEYAAAVETRIQQERTTSNFIRLGSNPEARARLRAGEISASSAKALGLQPSMAIPGGHIEHWIGAVFLPHATLAAAIPQLQNYENRKRYMSPEIIDSRTVSHQGNNFEVYLRLAERSILPGVFDLNLGIDYRLYDKELAIESRSARIVEVAGANAPVGSSVRDRGLLWALNHYWRMAEGDGGLYIECEALVLSRRPPGFAEWIIDPMIGQAARKTLISSLRATTRIIAKCCVPGTSPRSPA